MHITYELALQRLQLIYDCSSVILQMIQEHNDLNKEIERIKGLMAAVSGSCQEVRQYLEANKGKLCQHPPLRTL